MKKNSFKGEKGKNTIIGLLIVIIVLLVGLFILAANGYISFEKEEIHNADEYISLEDVVLSPKVTTKKVKLNYLDDSVTSEFYKEQEKVIDDVKEFFGDENNADYKLKYFINNNILSVLYKIERTDAMGTCATSMAVTNIDLVNNKVISEEELLKRAGTSYKKLTEEAYDKELENWKTINNNAKQEINFSDVTFKDYSTNKEKYVNLGLEKMPNVIYTYIENNQIKYDYYTIYMDTLFHEVGKGGCFNWNTEILGNY